MRDVGDSHPTEGARWLQRTVLRQTHYRRQLARLNRHIRDKLNLLDALLALWGLWRWGPHGGGYYAWLALPPGADEETLAA